MFEFKMNNNEITSSTMQPGKVIYILKSCQTLYLVFGETKGNKQFERTFIEI